MPPQRTRARRRAAWITLPSALIVCGFLYFLYALNYGNGAEKPLWTPPPRPEASPSPAPAPVTAPAAQPVVLPPRSPLSAPIGWVEIPAVASTSLLAIEDLSAEHVDDGDTLQDHPEIRRFVADFEGLRPEVRLLDVDAPELARSAQERDEPFSHEASRAVRDLVVRRPVRILVAVDADGQPKRDSLNRMLGYVFVRSENEAGWLLVNAWLIREGLGWFYPYRDTCDPGLRAQFLEVQQAAVEAPEPRGLWATILAQGDRPVYLSRNPAIFHLLSDCRGMAEPSRSTLRAAFLEGRYPDAHGNGACWSLSRLAPR